MATLKAAAPKTFYQTRNFMTLCAGLLGAWHGSLEWTSNHKAWNEHYATKIKATAARLNAEAEAARKAHPSYDPNYVPEALPAELGGVYKSMGLN